MLQSEFFERTKVTVPGDEYVKIETLYTEVEMDKDEFCKQWLKLRNNPLMKETIDAFFKSQQQAVEIAKLKKQLEEQKKFYEGAIEQGGKKWADGMMLFAKHIVHANENEDSYRRVYDVIEQEYGIAFIIKAKREAGIPLSEDEINYMVSKL